MNLKTGSLLWLDTMPDPPQYPLLEEDIDCDVLVIGSGVAGALISFYLQEQGLKTVVVDKRKVGMGSTSANTGLLQFGNDKHMTAFMNTFGASEGVRFYNLCKSAIDKLEHICASLELDSHFRRRDSLYYASLLSALNFINQARSMFQVTQS